MRQFRSQRLPSHISSLRRLVFLVCAYHHHRQRVWPSKRCARRPCISTFERMAVPRAEVRSSLIRGIKEGKQRLVWIVRFTYGVVGQNELVEICAVERGRRIDSGIGKPCRLWISVTIKSRVLNRCAS